MVNYQENFIKLKIGELISNKRKSLNLSQEALVEGLGIHVRTNYYHKQTALINENQGC